MASSIRVSKTCEYCKQEFIAKTIHTRYCSHRCNQKGYKRKERNAKVDLAVKVAGSPDFRLKQQRVDWHRFEGKPYLTLKEAALLLNITPVTLRRWVKEGIISSSKAGKKHSFDRKMLDRRFSAS